MNAPDLCRKGVVSTPAALARWLARQALDAWTNARSSKALAAIRVLDPAVGEGALLAAVQEELAARGLAPLSPDQFLGVDVRAEAVARARAAVRGRFLVGNALLEAQPADRSADIVIANPPYVGARDLAALTDGRSLIEYFGFPADLYEYFLRRSLVWARPGGVVAMLLPHSWTALVGKEPLRRLVLEHGLLMVARLPRACFQRAFDPGAVVIGVGRVARGRTCTYADLYHAAPGCIPTLNLFGERPPDPGIACWSVDPRIYRAAPRAIVFAPTRDNLLMQRRFGRRIAGWTKHESLPSSSGLVWRPGRWVPLSRVACVADVGIHSRNCRHKLFFARRDGRRLARLLQGAHVFPYVVRPDCPRARHRWVDVSYVPRPGVPGAGYGGRPSARDEYWDWQGDPAVHRRPRRILIRQSDDDLVAALFEQNGRVHYTDNTLFTCWPREEALSAGLTYEYLVAYLNSPAVNRLYQFLSQERGVRQAQIKIGLLRSLPFRIPRPAEIDEVSRWCQEVARAAAESRSVQTDAALARLNRVLRLHYEPDDRRQTQPVGEHSRPITAVCGGACRRSCRPGR